MKGKEEEMERGGRGGASKEEKLTTKERKRVGRKKGRGETEGRDMEGLSPSQNFLKDALRNPFGFFHHLF
jgi:hypothetical protein